MKRVFMSRQEAKVQGLKFYHPGFTCLRDHDSYHYVSTGRCVQCHRHEEMDTTARLTLHGTREQIEQIAAVWTALTGHPTPPPRHGTVVPNVQRGERTPGGPGHGHRQLTTTTAVYPEFDRRPNRKPRNPKAGTVPEY